MTRVADIWWGKYEFYNSIIYLVTSDTNGHGYGLGPLEHCEILGYFPARGMDVKVEALRWAKPLSNESYRNV
jgi:hypothetical protein